MLDDSTQSEKEMRQLKNKLSTLMHSDSALLPKFIEIFGFVPNPTKLEIMKLINNPLQRMHEMFEYI